MLSLPSRNSFIINPNITRVISAAESYVFDIKREGHFIEVEELIRFDPYMHLNRELLQKLYQKDKQEQSLTQDLLWDFASCYPDRLNKACMFEEILLGGARYVDVLGVCHCM